jgi:predicted amidohydrolase YtcJ
VSVPRSADTVFTGGRVLTFDDASTVAEAIAVVGDRIAAVGTTSRSWLCRSDVRVIPLSGRTVIPESSTPTLTWSARA